MDEGDDNGRSEGIQVGSEDSRRSRPDWTDTISQRQLDIQFRATTLSRRSQWISFDLQS